MVSWYCSMVGGVFRVKEIWDSQLLDLGCFSNLCQWSKPMFTMLPMSRYIYRFWNSRFVHISWSKGNQEKDGTWKVELIVELLCYLVRLPAKQSWSGRVLADGLALEGINSHVNVWVNIDNLWDWVKVLFVSLCCTLNAGCVVDLKDCSKAVSPCIQVM